MQWLRMRVALRAARAAESKQRACEVVEVMEVQSAAERVLALQQVESLLPSVGGVLAVAALSVMLVRPAWPAQ